MGGAGDGGGAVGLNSRQPWSTVETLQPKALVRAEALGGGREVGSGGTLGTRGKEFGQGLTVAWSLYSGTIAVGCVISLGGVVLRLSQGLRSGQSSGSCSA